jgi:polyketide cyclase/dehydrase/lipid transport protein
MPKLAMDVETSAPPEQVRDALIDFSDRRPDIWPGLDRSLYEVYTVGPTTADIKEGSRFPGMQVWAREHYDWAEPNTVRWTVQESNFSSVGSSVVATLHPLDGGGTRVHIDWNRTGSTLMGRVVIRMIVWTKGRPITASVEKALRRLERGAPGTT